MTKLFDVADQMESVCAAVPALVGRVGVERTLPLMSSALPAVNIIPRNQRRGDLTGEVQSRDASILLIVRTAGDRPGRDAHELLAAAHMALMTDLALNDESVQIELVAETFRYVDTEQSMCDLQADYQINYAHPRASLFGF